MLKTKILSCLLLPLLCWRLVSPAAAADAKDNFQPGLSLTFTQNGQTDTRDARVLALYVPAGQAPTPFLSPGPFTAKFTGAINLRIRSELSFSVAGAGKVTIKLRDAIVLEAAGDDFANKSSGVIKLEKGKNAIEVEYTPPAKGDAQLRIMWASREFMSEPVQPGSLVHDVTLPARVQGHQIRQGRELFANLLCAKCHDTQMPKDSANIMPEMGDDAPDLAQAGARLKEQWMASWIADPKAMRPDTIMPKVVRNAEQAADLAAYLASLGAAPAGDAKEIEAEAATQGSQLFGGLGCIGCHTKPDAPEMDKERGRVQLSLVNQKFQEGALKAWLLNPREHYKSTRMPDFQLTEFEADKLVAYLSNAAKGELQNKLPKGDAVRGKGLFAAMGCASCHSTIKENQNLLKARSIKEMAGKTDWAKGCAAVDYGLTDTQKTSLDGFAKKGMASLANDIPVEFATRTVAHLQCAACHGRDEMEDHWTQLADEVADITPPDVNVESDHTEDAAKGPRLFFQKHLGKLRGGDGINIAGDQTRPTLTWAGEKLRPQWAETFIAGKIDYKLRYWLRARMPAFPAHAKGLATGMAMEHGLPPVAKPIPAPDEALAPIGLKLTTSKTAGFECISCHSIGDNRAKAAFEVPAPNLMHSADRLNYDYYMTWMRKPLRLVPGTKMPGFSDDGKTTALKEVLEGDAENQFNAIWHYILQREKMPVPE